MYRATQKKESDMKNAVNQFISEQANEHTKAIVIDAETLLSSTALANAGVLKKNITVLNCDPHVVRTAKEHGFQSYAGYSTQTLLKLKGQYDIIYLDYCGTPKDNATHGFSPCMDLAWASHHLNKNGILLATFSRRCENAIEQANQIIPYGMQLVKEVTYHETCSMYCMILTNGSSTRVLRDAFNKCYMERRKKVVPKPKVPKPVPVVEPEVVPVPVPEVVPEPVPEPVPVPEVVPEPVPEPVELEENMFIMKRIVRRSIGAKRPFLIEWEDEASENTWEPWKHLPDCEQGKYFKNGKVRKQTVPAPVAAPVAPVAPGTHAMRGRRYLDYERKRIGRLSLGLGIEIEKHDNYLRVIAILRKDCDFKIGDHIHSVGGKTVDTVDTCVEALKSIPHGESIQMVISRRKGVSYNKYFALHGESKKRKRDDEPQPQSPTDQRSRMPLHLCEIEKRICHNGNFNSNSMHLARPYLLKNYEHIKRTYDRKAVTCKLNAALGNSTDAAMLAAIRKLVTYAGGKITSRGRKMQKGKYTYFYKILY